MAKPKTWKVNIDGMDHQIGYSKGVFKSRIIVDGIETPVKSKNAFIQLIDEPIRIGSKTLNLTAIGTKIDLAVDDIYVDSGKPYVPLDNIPGWANFITLFLIIGGWFWAGIVGTVIGLFGGMFVLSKSISIDSDNPLPLCLGITAVCLIIQVIYGVFLHSLLF